MRSIVSDRDEKCDQITHSLDDLITSVDAMRWRPGPEGGDPIGGSNGERDRDPEPWVPADCKARFDDLYAAIGAFAGAVDDRIRRFSDRVEGAFAEPSEDATRQ
jgi:hypothetical protein